MGPASTSSYGCRGRLGPPASGIEPVRVGTMWDRWGESLANSGFEGSLADRIDDDLLRAIPYGIASLHGEAKTLITKNPAGNGINEMHINLMLISNLILSLEKPRVELVRVY